ncbi:MAG: sigma-70 family RNA polymerase sigma factor [Hyphomonadaceae bacterium]|nr:sigma-70 family RNA polymerase sigma factor [Hyphomonadaceae bacterium]
MRQHDLVRLFEEMAPGLRRYLSRFGPGISADDIAQDAFARLAAAKPGTIEAPRAWLFRTARNIALNELARRKTAATDAVGDISALEHPCDAPSPEDLIQRSDEAQRLRAILALLPERQRVSLILFKLEGLSHKEIGQRLGVSHRTVERYIADAIAHCHAYLSAFRAED